MSRPPRQRRADYAHFVPITTRWMDNDIFGHVNNVVYLSFVDTVVNRYLREAGGLDPATSPIIPYAVESGCRYLASIAYPDPVTGGLRVGHLGRSSVRYEVGIFRADEDEAAAEAFFVHVFVDRTSERPVAIPEPVRAALARLLRRGPDD